jgi:hypothetical protein
MAKSKKKLNSALELKKEKPKVEQKEDGLVTPRKNRKPVPQDIKLNARQYVRACGHHWTKSAGFLAEMNRKVGSQVKKTRPEWKQLWDAFWTRPVKE